MKHPIFSTTFNKRLILLLLGGAFSTAVFANNADPQGELVGVTKLPNKIQKSLSSIRIGVIDSGIDYLHTSLGGNGLQITDDNEAIIDPNVFPNNIVVGGTDIAGQNRGDFDPIDHSGHGTFIASIIGGKEAHTVGQLEEIPALLPGEGIAAGAKIFAIRAAVLDGISDELNWALDPNSDGSNDDQMHIVSISVGPKGGFFYEEKETKDTKKLYEANKRGTIAVISAANDGNAKYIGLQNQLSENAVTVAASRRPDEVFVDASILNRNSALTSEEHISPEAKMQLLFANDFIQNDKAITAPLFHLPLSGKCDLENYDISGRIVFFSPTNCDPMKAASQLKSYGALAGIYPSKSLTFSGIVDQAQGAYVPIFAISTDIDTLQTHAKNQAEMTLHLDTQYHRKTPQMADLSSRLSNHRIFKPEITAPGQNVFSAQYRTGWLGRFGSGTSYAAPFASGALALIKAAKPQLSNAQVIALMMNYAEPIYSDKQLLEPLARQGMGEIRPARSIRNNVLATPAGVHFGFHEASNHLHLTRDIEIQNTSNTGIHYRLNEEKGGTRKGVRLEYPKNLWVGPYDTQKITLRLDISPHLFDANENNNEYFEMDGFIKLTPINAHKNIDPLRVGWQSIIEPSLVLKTTHENRQLQLRNITPVSGKAHIFRLLNKVPDITKEDLKLKIEKDINHEIEVYIEVFEAESLDALAQEISRLFGVSLTADELPSFFRDIMYERYNFNPELTLDENLTNSVIEVNRSEQDNNHYGIRRISDTHLQMAVAFDQSWTTPAELSFTLNFVDTQGRVIYELEVSCINLTCDSGGEEGSIELFLFRESDFSYALGTATIDYDSRVMLLDFPDTSQIDFGAVTHITSNITRKRTYESTTEKIDFHLPTTKTRVQHDKNIPPFGAISLQKSKHKQLVIVPEATIEGEAILF